MTNNPTKYAIVAGYASKRRYLTVSGGWHPSPSMAWAFDTQQDALDEQRRTPRHRNGPWPRVVPLEG